MTIRKKLAAVLAASALALGVSACGSNGDDNGNGAAAKVEGETFTVVTDTSYVPFEFQEDGKTVGFDIDLINAIAEEAGFEIDLKNSNFDGIIPGLQTNSYDMAIAGIGITEERKKSVDYSDPYYRAGLIVAVPKDNEEIKGIDDLKGKKVATRLGSTSAKYLADNLPDAEAQPYEQLDQAYLAVENGRADAILYDEPNVAYYIKTKGEGLKMVGEADDTVDFGIAFPKGSDDLRTAVNDALQNLRDDGKYNELHKEWFGVDAKN